jgi:SOS-response transcriptional repressor LexA
MSQDCSYNELYPLQVLDDSMEPEFPHKCIIVVEPSGVCATGAYVVAEAHGDRWFRQFVSEGQGRKRLVALNPGYPDMELVDGEYKILGVVVQRNLGRKIKHYYPYVPGGVPPKAIESNR